MPDQATYSTSAGGNDIPSKIRSIIDRFYHGPARLLLNPHYSNEKKILVSVTNSNEWFFIATSFIEEITQIGYRVADGKEFPIVEIRLNEKRGNLTEELGKRRWAAIDEGFEIRNLKDLNIFANDDDDPPVRELSGSQWVARFPGSRSVADLNSPFRENVTKFQTALSNAGASVNTTATFRPFERAYLMHYAFDINAGTIKPADVPAQSGVNINWVHPNEAASLKAAKDMVTGYGIVFRPAFPTKHSDHTAIDMDISWSGTLKIKRADGNEVQITTEPRDNRNTDLHAVGATYSVIKLVADKPHWSDTGN